MVSLCVKQQNSFIHTKRKQWNRKIGERHRYLHKTNKMILGHVNWLSVAYSIQFIQNKYEHKKSMELWFDRSRLKLSAQKHIEYIFVRKKNADWLCFKSGCNRSVSGSEATTVCSYVLHSNAPFNSNFYFICSHNGIIDSHTVAHHGRLFQYIFYSLPYRPIPHLAEVNKAFERAVNWAYIVE